MPASPAVNPSQFAAAVLKGVGAPLNQNNVAALVGWAKAEGGNWGNNASYNPLNTTQGAPGARAINGVGVKAYNNWQQGIGATVQTLRNGNYGGILQALQASNPSAVAKAIGASPWGTNGQLVAQTIASAAGQRYNLGGPASSLSSPQSRGPAATPGVAPVATPGFNQQAFNQDQARYIAGSFLKGSGANPYAAEQPKTGLSTTASANPLISSGALLTKAPNPADYQTAQAALQKIAGAPLNQHPAAFNANLKGSGYTNPLPGASWERTDMGVDASMKPGAPIRALGDSKVAAIYPNWYQGQPYVKLQLLNGPQAGKYYYVAEAINPTVKQGQVVKAGQTIGTYNAGGTGLELGWGTSGSQTLAQATGRDNAGTNDHANTPAGVNFRNFLNGLGANAG